jgi:hypothetical protein
MFVAQALTATYFLKNATFEARGKLTYLQRAKEQILHTLS